MWDGGSRSSSRLAALPSPRPLAQPDRHSFALSPPLLRLPRCCTTLSAPAPATSNCSDCRHQDVVTANRCGHTPSTRVEISLAREKICLRAAPAERPHIPTAGELDPDRATAKQR